MANEVDITITAHDLSGPGFASALANLERLKAAAAALRREVGDIGSPEIDANRLTSSLLLLKQKMQSLGIADIADVNINPGMLMVQLQTLKRLIQQSGISDILDVNISQSSLQSAMARVAQVTREQTVPVVFDISSMPKLPIPAPVSESVTQTVRSTGGFGTPESVGAPVSQAALAAMNEAINDTYKLNAGFSSLRPAVSAVSDAFAAAGARAQMLSDAIGVRLNPYIVSSGIYWDRFRDSVVNAGSAVSYFAQNALISTRVALSNMGDRIAAVAGGIGGFGAALGGAGFAAGRFGGILGGTIGGVALWHVALDGIIEAVISLGLAIVASLPAISVFANVGQDIATNLQSQHVLFESLGYTVGPLTGKFDALAKAMAPQVIEAYGGALTIVQSQTGLFGQATTQVAHIFDDWVAKIGLFVQGQKFGAFLQSGEGYLQQFGQIIGTLGIALDGLLTKDPGIAHYLLDIVNASVQLLKAFTDLPGPIVQTVLVAHGLYLWGAVMVGLFGPLVRGFINMGVAVANIAGPMLGLSTATGRMAGTFAGISAVSWAWAAVAAVAIAGIAYEMTQADSSTKRFIGDIDHSLSGLSASQAIPQISLDIGSLQAQMDAVPVKIGNIAIGLVNTAKAAGSFFGQVLKDAPASNQQFTDLWHGVTNAVSAFFGFQSAGPIIMQLNNDTAAYTGEITKLTGQQDNLFATTGMLIRQGNTYSQSLAIMDLAGIQAGDSLAVMEAKVNNLIKGYQNIIGPGGALNNSLNAVNFAALQQQSQVASLNSGWDAFISTITGGESGLLVFASDLNTISKNAKVAGASFGELNPQSVALRQSFQQGVVDANKYADNLTLLASASGGGASKTSMLNQAVFDLVAQMLPAAKGSRTLTTELYALAQRGGYTGANSFVALSKAVDDTKNPMHDLQGKTDALTRSAGNLITDVQNLSIALGTTLNNAIATAIFQASGGQTVFDNFATAITNTGVRSQITKTSAQQLAISLYDQLGRNVSLAKSEFESFARFGLGLTKNEADILWRQTLPSLQNEINRLHGKNIPITATLGGTGQVVITGQGPASSIVGAGEIRLHSAAGGLVTMGTGPTADDVPALVSKGETIVSASDSKKLSSAFAAIGVPGYSLGGLIGSLDGVSPGISGIVGSDIGRMAKVDLEKVIAADKAKVMSAIAASSSAPSVGGPLPSGVVTVAKYVMAHGGNRFAAAGIGGVVAGESGGNPEAVEAGGRGRGLIQWTPGSSAAPYQPIITGNVGRDMAVQLADMMHYIAGRGGLASLNNSGSARNAAWLFSAMEAPAIPGSNIRMGVVDSLYAAGYDHGGWLPPGVSLAVNNTGRPERIPSPDGGGQDIHVMLELGPSFRRAGLTEEQIRDIRYTVTRRGGGSVQTAFGKPGC